MNKENSLLPCPFCGSPAKPWGPNVNYIDCSNLDCTAPPMPKDKWNTRPTVTPADGDAERALEELIRQATSADRIITAEDETKLIEAEEVLRAVIKGDKS